MHAPCPPINYFLFQEEIERRNSNYFGDSEDVQNGLVKRLSTISSPSSEPQELKSEMVPGGPTKSGEALSAQSAEDLIATPGSSKARQKKFHRHFKTVSQDERVLNYYSCALVADILLQGHLYITKNYFAFYSNVFGYVTKLLIPTSAVLKVTKEKTAYIIPNAVGITTEDDKHVFGSLLSRDSTYKLMVQVWNAAAKPTPTPVPLPPTPSEGLESGRDVTDCPVMTPINDEESSLSDVESNLDSKITNTSKSSKVNLGVEAKSFQHISSQTVPMKPNLAQYYNIFRAIPKSSIILFISTILLVVLFTSATVLLFRISRLQEEYTSELTFDARSISEVQEFLDTNLKQISKVRQSLEALSLLVEGGGTEIGKRKWTKFSNDDFQNS